MAFSITVPIFYVVNVKASGSRVEGQIKSGIAQITVQQSDPNAVIPYIEIYKSLEKNIVDGLRASLEVEESVAFDCIFHKFDVLLPHKNFEFFPSKSSRSPIRQII